MLAMLDAVTYTPNRASAAPEAVSKNKKQWHDVGRADAVHSDRIHPLRRHHESQNQSYCARVILAGEGRRQYPDGRADTDQACRECT
jgi:hypothetical protein